MIFVVEKVQPMVVEKITTIQPVVPALIRKKDNPILGLQVVAKGRGAPKKVTAVKVDLEGTTDPKAVKAVRLLNSGGSMNARDGKVFGEGKRSGKEWVFRRRSDFDFPVRITFGFRWS